LSKKRIAEATFIVVILGVLSKVLGFAREQMIAVFFGATGRTDAYVVANMIPVLITGLISGPLSTAFLPVFASHVAKGDREGASRLASSMITISTVGVLFLAVMAMFPADHLVRLVAPGFSGETFSSAVALTRVFLPAMVIPLLSSFAKTILNSNDHFAVPALAPSIQNLVIVAVVALFAPTFGVTSLAVAVVLGYLAAFAVQVPSMVKVGGWPKATFRVDDSVTKVFKLSWPLMAGSLFSQFYLFVDRNLASHLPEGSIAALSFADRIRQVPLGLFVAAVVTVVYPSLSGMWAQKDQDGFKETTIMGLRYVEFVCIPAALGLMVLANPVVRVIFQHGAFTREATALTASALLAYCPALVGMAAIQIINVAFYSSQETRIPVLLAAGVAALNTVLDLLLIKPFGHVGLALANSAANLLGALAGLHALNRMSRLPLRSLFRSLTKILLASGTMGVVALALSRATGFHRAAESILRDAVSAGIVIGGAGLSYLLLAAVLKCEELSAFLGLLKRSKGSP
jgi:putative peptidoglycan lipid II flippase